MITPLDNNKFMVTLQGGGDRIIATFDTLAQAQLAEQQMSFVMRLCEIATQLGQIADSCPDLFKIYWDRGYNAGGAHPFTDANLAPLGIGVAEATSLITLIEQFDNFANSRATAVTDYKSVMNKTRTDV